MIRPKLGSRQERVMPFLYQKCLFYSDLLHGTWPKNNFALLISLGPWVVGDFRALC